MSARWWAAAAAGVFLLSSFALAVDYDAAALRAVVEKSGDKFVDAWTKRDAKALAALFTEDAEYVDSSGVIFHGREAIEAEYAAAFEQEAGGKLELDVQNIRPIAEGVLVEDGVSFFFPKDDGPSSEMRYTVTHLKQADGSWLMGSVRELSSPNLTPHERLKALGWLHGKWREEVDGRISSTEWKWSEDGNFLLGTFSVRDANGESLAGTHRIGYDAERKQFRSWIFDADGGFAEGAWNAGEGNAWSVNLSGVDAEGRRRSLLLTYVPEGDDAIVMTREQTHLGGQAVPDAAHRIVRQPPDPRR